MACAASRLGRRLSDKGKTPCSCGRIFRHAIQIRRVWRRHDGGHGYRYSRPATTDVLPRAEAVVRDGTDVLRRVILERNGVLDNVLVPFRAFRTDVVEVLGPR